MIKPGFLFGCLLLTVQLVLGQNLDDQLFNAVKENDAVRTSYLIRQGADVNSRDINQATVLMWAMYKADLQLIKALVKAGADPKSKGVIYLDSLRQGYYGNLIGIAAGEGDLEKLKYLIEELKIPLSDREYDPNSNTNDGWTAADWAWENCKECHMYLDSLGFNIVDSKRDYLHLVDSSFGKYHDHYAEALLQLGIYAFDYGDFPLAERCFEEVPEYYENRKNDLNSLQSMFFLGMLYEGQNNYPAGERILNKTEIILANMLSKNDASYNPTLHIGVIESLGYVSAELGKISRAEELFSKALDFSGVIYGTSSEEYLANLDNLTILKKRLGDFNAMNELSQKGLSIARTNSDLSVITITSQLNNRAQYFVSIRDYESAMALLVEAELLCEQSQIENDDILNNLGILNALVGNIDIAHEKLLEVLHRRKEQSNSKGIINSLLNLAASYHNLNNLEEEEKCYLESKKLIKQQHYSFHKDELLILRKLGMLNYRKGLAEEAASYFEELLEVSQVQFNDNFFRQSSIEKFNFLRLLSKGFDVFRSFSWQVSNSANQTSNHFAVELGLKGVILNSEIDFRNAVSNGTDSSRSELFSRWLTVRNQLNDKYVDWANREDYVGIGVSLEMKNDTLRLKEIFPHTPADLAGLNDGDAVIAVDTITVAGVGMGVNEISPFLIGTRHTAIDLKIHRKNRDGLFTVPVVRDLIQPGLIQVQELEYEIRILEKAMARSTSEFSKRLKLGNVKWQDVQAKLGDEDVAIEFSSFPYCRPDGEWSDSTMYVALILRKGYESPVMVKLCEEKDLEIAFPKRGRYDGELIEVRGAKSIGTGKNSSYGERLYELLWQPLDSLLFEGDKIYFAPSGLLHRIAFSAISDGDSGQLLLDQYNLNRVSTTGKLLDVNEKYVRPNDIVLFGGIKYDWDMLATTNHEDDIIQNAGLSMPLARDLDCKNSDLDSLVHTRVEIDNIDTIATNANIQVVKYFGANATEERVKSLGGKNSPTILHIATHGFFCENSTDDKKEEAIQNFEGSDQTFRYSDDPLNRSGLMFAGANSTWNGDGSPDGMEDGILTANEATYIPLNNTELVVLSACKTGLGEIRDSEGVFGLQRAFKAAGVNYIMMSLWKVPDEPTSEFMTAFYGQYLSGSSIPDSYHKAQKHMRVLYPEDPYKWAAFVLMR